MWRTEKVRAPSTHVSMCSPPSGPCCNGARLNAGWCRVRAQRTTTETCVSSRLNLTFELPAQLPDDRSWRGFARPLDSTIDVSHAACAPTAYRPAVPHGWGTRAGLKWFSMEKARTVAAVTAAISAAATGRGDDRWGQGTQLLFLCQGREQHFYLLVPCCSRPLQPFLLLA